jgi:hypothetical protein
MGTLLIAGIAVMAAGAAGWLGLAIVRLLREVVDELRHIRKSLQGLSGEVDKLSGPIGDVKKLYGIGERVFGRKPKA